MVYEVVIHEYHAYIQFFQKHHAYIRDMDRNPRIYLPPGIRNSRQPNGRNIVSLPSSPNYQFHIPSTPTNPTNHHVPMPPSASNFVNQNQFTNPSPASSPHAPLEDPFRREPPPHLQYNPMSAYNMPENQRFVPPGPPPRPSTRPLRHNQEHIAAVSSSKTLPSVAHIPLLTGRVDFGAWNDGVRTLILHLGYLGHISDPPLSGRDPLPDRIPSYMPIISATSTSDDFSAYRLWWECDNVVSHVLMTRLNAVTRSLLPYDDGDSSSPRTARTIYYTLCEAYHIRGFSSGSALYNELRSLPCGSRVQDYVTKWRAGISQLRGAHYPLIIREVIQAFLVKLPASIPFQMLRHETMRKIDTIHDDDVMSFIRVTNEALDIDSHYRPAPPTSVPRQSSHSVAHILSTVSTSVPSTTTGVSNTAPRSSLICSNCQTRGHTVDTCFKAGGGLEGQRDKYQANRTRAQAHLAHLDDAMANRQRVQAFLVQMEDVLDGNDFHV